MQSTSSSSRAPPPSSSSSAPLQHGVDSLTPLPESVNAEPSMQDLTECGFGNQFCGQKFDDLMDEGGVWFKQFMRFLYNVCKIPFLSVYTQPEATIPPDIWQDQEARVGVITTKVIHILWINGIHMGSKVGRKSKTDDSGVVPQLPLNVSVICVS